MSSAKLLLAVALTGGLGGCYAPLGPLGHRPELLFNLPVTPPTQLHQESIAGEPLVVPMLSSQVTYPTGAFYNLQLPDLGPLAQTYGSRESEVAFYEALIDALRARGHNVLRDYDPGRLPLPGDKLAFLRGELRTLEIDSIHPDPESGRGEDERTIYDAARARLVFKLLEPSGRLGVEFAIVAACKLHRGQGDILRELGVQVAAQVEACIRDKHCVAAPSRVAPADSDEPHSDAWAAGENAQYGEAVHK